MMFRYAFSAFTAPCEMHFETSTQQNADALYRLIRQEVYRLEQTYSYFIDSSELYRINHRKTHEFFVSQEMYGILKLAFFYYQKTAGTFDVAYAGTLKEVMQNTSLASYQQARKRLEPFASMKHVILENHTLRFSNPHTKIDLGGFVKEYAVDMCIALLKQHRIASALINFGGDLAVIGKCNEEKWRIGIQNPENEKENILIWEIEDHSLCTSGHSKRFTRIEDQRFSHVLAPEINGTFEQVSLMAPTTLDAGIWSTSLLINPTLTLPKHIVPVCLCRLDEKVS